jgi:hypothetical protein
MKRKSLFHNIDKVLRSVILGKGKFCVIEIQVSSIECLISDFLIWKTLRGKNRIKMNYLQYLNEALKVYSLLKWISFIVLLQQLNTDTFEQSNAMKLNVFKHKVSVKFYIKICPKFIGQFNAILANENTLMSFLEAKNKSQFSCCQ